jgi:hypothetical protein
MLIWIFGVPSVASEVFDAMARHGLDLYSDRGGRIIVLALFAFWVYVTYDLCRRSMTESSEEYGFVDNDDEEEGTESARLEALVILTFWDTDTRYLFEFKKVVPLAYLPKKDDALLLYEGEGSASDRYGYVKVTKVAQSLTELESSVHLAVYVEGKGVRTLEEEENLIEFLEGDDWERVEEEETE